MKARKALFDHSEPYRFTQGRWVRGNKVTIAYLASKWIVALFMLTNLFLSLWYNFDHFRGTNNGSKYMIFATHWGLVLIVAALSLDAILVLARFRIEISKVYMKKRHPHYEDCHGFLKLSIWMTATAYPAALFITLSFWTLLHDWHKPWHWDMGTYLNLAVHLFQSIVALLDTFLSSRPWRLWHIWCPLLFFFLYLTFNVLYIVAFDGRDPYGNDYVYDILDWNDKPGQSALYVFGCLVALLVFFACFYMLAKLRDSLWAKWQEIVPEGDSVPLSTGKSEGIYVISIQLKADEDQ